MKWTANLTGYVEIALWGENPERVLNMALSRGLVLWNIVSVTQTEYRLNVGLGSFRAICRLVRRSGCRLKIKRKRGLPFFFKQIKKRKVLVVGTFLFCLILYLLSSFVWFVEVIGNKEVARELVLEKAVKYGLKRGVPQASVNNNLVAEKLLGEIPQLSWVGIHEQGTKIIIEVAEKTLPPSNNENTPANLIARTEGEIVELLVLQGTPLVEEGARVRAGQILILGLIYPEVSIGETGEISPAGEPRAVRAKGLVRARVFREASEFCSLKEKLTADTRRKKAALYLKFGDKEVYLKGSNKNPFHQYRVIRQRKSLSFQDLELIRIIYQEQKSEILERHLEEAFEEAARRAREIVWQKVPSECKIISQSFEPWEGQKDGIMVKYKLETIEEIGRYLPEEE